VPLAAATEVWCKMWLKVCFTAATGALPFVMAQLDLMYITYKMDFLAKLAKTSEACRDAIIRGGSV